MKQASGVHTGNSEWMQEIGPLKVLLRDPSITEIMVNRWDRIFVERNGIIQEVPNIKFESADDLLRAIQAIVVTIAKEINRRTPYLDARMPDGSRLNIVIPPVALDGPSLTIRKFSSQTLNYRNLLQQGTIDDKLLYFLMQAVKARKNLVVSGGTGTGKTTLLNILASLIPPNERIITIEDTAEMQLPNKNLVRMEGRLPIGNEPGISIQDLVRNALRMRPDRIVVGECRGSEAWDMLIAMNTGHEGSLTSIHANAAADALRRIEAMVLRAGLEAPLSMIQEDISKTIHLIIQLERGSDGRRRVVEVMEVVGRKDNGYKTQDIFTYDPTDGLRSTGVVPHFFIEEGKAKGLQFSEIFFDPQHKVKLAS